MWPATRLCGGVIVFQLGGVLPYWIAMVPSAFPLIDHTGFHV